jgi:death on curing protein
MVKHLTKHGNSYALVIDKPILELLRADSKTRFEIVTDGNSLLLTPVRVPKEEKKFEEALKMTHERFGRALKKLAEEPVAPLFLDLDRVLRIHRSVIDAYGGAEGIRDAGLLHSAIAMPQASFGGNYLHSDLFEMAAAYLYHIVQNHPFIDGNKRTGAASAVIFLAMNDILLRPDEERLVEITLQVATSQIGKQAVTAFFRSIAK